MSRGSISRRTFATIAGTALASGLLPRRLAALDRSPHATAAPPRLIVRGDDMGFAHAGNEAIIASYVNGIESAIEVLAPSPWFPEAAQMLAAHPGIDVGVHLTLTSEWDNLKWRPLSTGPSLRDSDGFFFPMAFPNLRYPGRSVTEKPPRLEEIEQEFRAQIELVKKHVPRVSHLSGHMGCTGVRADVKAMTKRLAMEYALDIAPEDHGVVSARYVGAHETSAEKIESFLRMLDGLENGKTYLFVDHPGLDRPELRAIHHLGYENVAADRQGVTDTFTSPRVRDRLTRRRIQLIGYRDLKR
ncbi:MAG: polysaccharide deacetylase family protein [Gemmatimonadaceae bacterium]